MKTSETKEEFEAERIECVAEAKELREQFEGVEAHIKYIDQEIDKIKFQALWREVENSKIENGMEMLARLRSWPVGDFVSDWDFESFNLPDDVVEEFLTLCASMKFLRRVYFIFSEDGGMMEFGLSESLELATTGRTNNPISGDEILMANVSYGYRITS